VIVLVDEPPDGLPAFGPAATVVRKGAVAAVVYESLAASGRNNLVAPLPSSILPYVAYDRTPNLNAVVNARFSRLRCVAGGGNMRERSAVACLFRPGLNSGLRGDRGGRTAGSRLSLSSSSSALAVAS
jgi:hypothetical protein